MDHEDDKPKKRVIEISEESEDSLDLDTPPCPIEVNYKSACGKVVKQFMGQIVSKESSSLYTVKFMKKCYGEGDKYIFPEKDDCEFVNLSQIIRVVKVPNYNGRYFTLFSKNRS